MTIGHLIMVPYGGQRVNTQCVMFFIYTTLSWSPPVAIPGSNQSTRYHHTNHPGTRPQSALCDHQRHVWAQTPPGHWGKVKGRGSSTYTPGPRLPITLIGYQSVGRCVSCLLSLSPFQPIALPNALTGWLNPGLNFNVSPAVFV
ncbi:hypothetical protein LCGC14_1306110 [marine sediment metagenome]|uniref:Uncharacterized protein n=1 Tax=marine sediment metagenome TaxID=412755 RepID=A0A0F9L8P3_9ZZZZ